MAKSLFAGIALFIGNNDKTLINQALNSLDVASQMRVIRNASLNGTGLQKMTVAKGIRPLNLNVETRSGTHRTWSGRKLFVYPGMKIIDMVPEEAYLTWQSDMLVPGAKEIPFAQWLWEQEFVKLAAEINDSCYLGTYAGNAIAYNAGTAYAVGDAMYYGAEQDIYRCVTITTAGQTPDTHPAKWLLINDLAISTGPGTIIANEITGGGIAGANLITTGALSSSNTLTKTELMVRSMTVAHRNLGGTIKMSPVSYMKYLDEEKTIYPNVLDQKMGSGEKMVYGFPKWKVEQCTWMGSSSRLIATQKNNLIYGTNVESDQSKVAKTIETLHGSRSVVKWLQGFEIADLETFYVNEQV